MSGPTSTISHAPLAAYAGTVLVWPRSSLYGNGSTKFWISLSRFESLRGSHVKTAVSHGFAKQTLSDSPRAVSGLRQIMLLTNQRARHAEVIFNERRISDLLGHIITRNNNRDCNKPEARQRMPDR